MDITSFQRLAEEKGVSWRAWGLSGSDAANTLSARLGIELASEFREFVENFGNLAVGHFLIAVTGNEKGEMSAESSTEFLLCDDFDLSSGNLRIMEHAGESYLVDAASGEVSACDSLNIKTTERTLNFGNFDEFLRWVVNESAEGLNDVRFRF